MKVTKEKFISREMVQANPHKIFLFGDNTERKGLGGQAGQMRGEPNTQGIVTKRRPDNSLFSYFTDSGLIGNKILIDQDFEELETKVHMLEKELGMEIEVVVPEDGLGTGLAKLGTMAPKTFAYLQERLARLEE